MRKDIPMIDIKENLFNILLKDYKHYKKNNDYQNQFQTGIDFFEEVLEFVEVDKEVVKYIEENK
jgi:hypothetical protein